MPLPTFTLINITNNNAELLFLDKVSNYENVVLNLQ